MRSSIFRIVRRLAAVFVLGVATMAAGAATAQQEAILATVVGEKVQKVGYRALIQKQAIMYNLAGYARNDPDGTVGVRLQGDKNRIDKALQAVSAGNRASSQANVVGVSSTPLDPNLKTFTILGWTSQSRDISNPYDLVFRLRPTDDEISAKEAKAVWDTIAEGALKGEDRTKFLRHLEDAE
jgi:acylphosphatase